MVEEIQVGEKEQTTIDPLGAFMLTGAVFGGDLGPATVDGLCQAVEGLLGTLTERQRRILELRFGLRDGQSRTREAIGKEFRLTRERIRQIEGNALRRLRHPTRSRLLKSVFLETQVGEISQSLSELRQLIAEINQEILETVRDKRNLLHALGAKGTLIEEMELPSSVLASLRGAGLRYAHELLNDRTLRSIRGIGEKSVATIREALSKLGIKRPEGEW